MDRAVSERVIWNIARIIVYQNRYGKACGFVVIAAGSGARLSMSDIPEDHRRAGPARKAGASLIDPNAQIASKLKALYNAVEQEPIPDMFLDLLEKLDQAERCSKSRT
jgi:hypothetical protein